MTQIGINIDSYLSEDEKKELAIQVFKDQVKKNYLSQMMELFNQIQKFKG